MGTGVARSPRTLLADPDFHGYLSSGTEKLVRGEFAWKGSKKMSPIQSFMATLDRLAHLSELRVAKIIRQSTVSWLTSHTYLSPAAHFRKVNAFPLNFVWNCGTLPDIRADHRNKSNPAFRAH